MKRSIKQIALCLCACLLCTSLWGCESQEASIYGNGEPPTSTGSEPYTPEDVFRKLTNAGDIKLTVIYSETTEKEENGNHESAVLEKDGDRVKVTLKDNDESNLYYYDLGTSMGYQQNSDGKWEGVSVAETMPDWMACLQQAFSISNMSSRLSWLFASDTYEPYDAKTGRCQMKTSEMTEYFGQNWTQMTAYLMQSGDIYYLYLFTADDIGSITYKLVMEYTDIDVKLPK